MITKVLILDDDEDWANDLRKSIERLEESFFNTLETDITKITCAVATSIDKALEIIKLGEIDFITLDIKLAGEEDGHEFYNDVFQLGLFVPSIALSGEIKTPNLEKEIKNMGIRKIIHKSSSGQDNVDIRAVKGICEVLEDPEIRYAKIIEAVEHFDIFEHKFEYNSKQKTGKEWWNEITNKTITKKDAKQIMDLMHKECFKHDPHDQRSEYD